MSAFETVTRGTAEIFVAAVGATAPDRDDIATLEAGTFAGYTSQGATIGPVAVSDAPEFVNLRVAGKARPLRKDIKAITSMVSTALADLTAANIAAAFGGTVASNVVSPAGVGPLTVRQLAIVGDFWDGEKVLITVQRAVLSPKPTLTWDEGNQTSIDVEWEVLEPVTGDPYQVLPPVAA